MPRITVTISVEEAKALSELASEQRRDRRDQAAILIQQQLEQCGALKKQEEISLLKSLRAAVLGGQTGFEAGTQAPLNYDSLGTLLDDVIQTGDEVNKASER